jgi:O-succinylbenzoic acid--CoA ligase
MPHLTAIDLPGGTAFVHALQRVWDRGDAAWPVDQRASTSAKRAAIEALAPSSVIGPDDETTVEGGRSVEPGDALVMATSGTTGIPKGVVLTHDAVRASALATSARLGVDARQHRWLACLPLNHVGGLSVITRSLHTGTPVEALPVFDADEVSKRAGPDVLVSLVATALRRVDAAQFHTVVLGGSAPPAVRGANVVTTYGLTETGSGVVYDGVPLDRVEVDIDGEGQIRLRGPMLLRAYRDGTVPLDREHWLATGDAGHFDDRGRLVVHGRLHELIITGGENVWPAAVEAILADTAGVAEVAVAGRPDPEWGERVVAWIVPADPAVPPGLDALRAAVRDRLAAYAAPKEAILVDALPKTAIGKVRRDALTRPEEHGQAGPPQIGRSR